MGTINETTINTLRPLGDTGASIQLPIERQVVGFNTFYLFPQLISELRET